MQSNAHLMLFIRRLWFTVNSQSLQIPCLRPSVVFTLIFCCFQIFTAFKAVCEPAPQFAFSIGSNQIPSGIWPTALGADSAGKIYISSLWNVIKIDTNGTVLTAWGTQGAGPGQFSYAGQPAFDDSGHVYVLDGYNSRVEQFDTNGNFIRTWGSYGSGPGQFDQPEGLAVSRSGRVYVSDSLNFRIQVFSAGGVFLKQFGTIGTNEGQFSFPGVIAVDSSNSVYIVDSPGGSFDNFRVQKFDADGNFLLQFPSHGVNANTQIQIGGIATDKANNIYVADGANDVVQKFTSQGEFLAQWGVPGNGPGQFNGPSGIAIDPTGNYVYVSDYYNARVNVFAYSAMAPLLYQAPTNQVVPIGVDVTEEVGVFGAQPLAYQWFFAGTAIPGGTEPSLVISNVPSSAAGKYWAIASNSLGSVTSGVATLTVQPVVVTTLPASGISETGAILNGRAWVGSLNSTAWFEWGTNFSYGQLAGFTNVGSDTNFLVSARLSGLSGEIVYHYRFASSNDIGTVYGQDAAFQIGLKPTVQTLPITPIDNGSVSLNALVNPEARDTSVFFRWGRYNTYQSTTPTNQLSSLSTPTTVQNVITGLTAGAVYSYQPVASNALGLVNGTIANFVAPPWVLLPVPSGNFWNALACSADGSKLAAASSVRVYESTNSGMTWNSNSFAVEGLQTITMSADGTHLLVGSGATIASPAYFSTNFGKSWIQSKSPNRHWQALCSSGDGQLVAAVDPVAQSALTSTNGGLIWQTNSPSVPAKWSSIACSADGKQLIIAAGGVDRTTNGPVYTSADFGQSWVSNNLPVSYWRTVGSSASGEVLVAAVGGMVAGPVYISTDRGISWSLTSAPVTNWQSVAVSADGTTIAALARINRSPLFISTDLGATWQSYVLPEAIWSQVVLSADGAKLFACGDQNIFELARTPTPGIKAAFSSQGLALSWVIPSQPFMLQQRADLVNGQWTNVAASPVLNSSNNTYQITIANPEQSMFYRIKETGAQN